MVCDLVMRPHGILDFALDSKQRIGLLFGRPSELRTIYFH